MLREQHTLLETLLAEERQESSWTAMRQTSTTATYNSGWLQGMAVHPISNQTLVQRGFRSNEPEEYNALVRTIFRKIDDCKSKLEGTRHTRNRNGVLNIHSSEIVQFQRVHGPQVFQFFENFEDVHTEYNVPSRRLLGQMSCPH